MGADMNLARVGGVAGIADSLAEQAAIRLRRVAVGEMLATLETATAAGRHHLMNKMVTLFAEEASRADARVGDQERRRIALSLAALEREVARRAPDEAAFNQRAAVLVDALFCAA